MGSEWGKFSFEELLAGPVRNGIYKKKEFHGRGSKIVNMGELFAHPRLRAVAMKRVELNASEESRFLLKSGDLIFARRSLTAEGAGKCSVVLEVDEATTFESSIIRARPDKSRADSLYLYYFFNSPAGAHSLDTIRRQVAVAGITGSDLAKLLIPVPTLQEQRAIAHILGTLDDKIELNRKQNETLEAMARALFKAWFVNFEPVRAKLEGRWQRGQSLPGLPAHIYDLFPDNLVNSELGDIPDGWRILAFGDVARQGKGVVNPSFKPDEQFTHYSLPAFDAGMMPSLELGEAIKSNKTPIPDSAVLVSKLNPHIPRIWMIDDAGDNAVCSTEFIVWTAKEGTTSAFIYFLASSQEFVSAMSQLVAGTSNSHQRVKPRQMEELRVIAADDRVIQEFSDLVTIFMKKVLHNRRQSAILAKLRNTLLPKLISGDLRIPDAETFLTERGL